MYEPIWKAVVSHLSVERMMIDISEFFEESRWSSFDRILNLARQIAAKMEEAGMADAELIEFPADGRTAYGGWVLPKAYDVEEARLTEIVNGGAGEVLADYNANPTSLMMYSCPTPPEGITADLVIADRLEDFSPEKVSGRLVLTSRLGINYSQAAVRAGAAGIISDCKAGRSFMKEGAYLDETNEWHNYTIPPWDDPDKGFGFAITPRQGRYLRERIEAGGKVRLHALVKTRHYDGVLPVISGRLPGESEEEIFVAGHYDEFGADDNCSQVAVGLEVVRAIKAMLEAGEIPPLRRSIRLLFPMEVRGFNALAQDDEQIRNLKVGINIDTVGTDQNAVTALCNLTSNFLALPSFADDFAAELLEMTRKENPLFRWRSSGAETIDNIFGEPLIGAPTPAIYHFSGTHHVALDTPDRISGRMLRDMSRLTATYAAFLANAGLNEALWLAELSAQRGVQRIHDLAGSSLRGSTDRRGLLRQLRSIQEIYSQKAASASWLTPPSQEEYTRRAEELRTWISQAAEEAEALIRGRSENYYGIELPRGSKPAPASQCIPVKAFRGFLSFEDLSREKKNVVREMGIHIGWGAPMWLQNALMFANGQRTAAEIAQLLRLHGVGVPELPDLEKIFAFLAERGLVHLRDRG
jgi:hypothetical protein